MFHKVALSKDPLLIRNRAKSNQISYITHLTLLLPTRGEERGVLGVESISVAILPSYQNMKIIALQLHNMNIVG